MLRSCSLCTNELSINENGKHLFCEHKGFSWINYCTTATKWKQKVQHHSCVAHYPLTNCYQGLANGAAQHTLGTLKLSMQAIKTSCELHFWQLRRTFCDAYAMLILMNICCYVKRRIVWKTVNTRLLSNHYTFISPAPLFAQWRIHTNCRVRSADINMYSHINSITIFVMSKGSFLILCGLWSFHENHSDL